MISVDKLEKNSALNRKFEMTSRVAPKPGDCTPSQLSTNIISPIKSSESQHSLMVKNKPQIGALSQNLIRRKFRVKEDRVDQTIIEQFAVTPSKTFKAQLFDQQETTTKEATEQTERWTLSQPDYCLERVKINRSFSFFNDHSVPRNPQEIEVMYQCLSDFKITRPSRS